MNLKIKRETVYFLIGALVVFGIVQVLIVTKVLNSFWITIILIGGVMAMVSLGLNLIYGINGQFSLGQWGFYAIGAYTAADITFRWTNLKSADGLTLLLLVTLLAGTGILLMRRMLSRVRGLDALSAFTLYLIMVLIMIFVAVFIGRALTPVFTGILQSLPANTAMQVVFFLSILIAGLVAAEISFMFGLPVLTLGSDYFGIATLGFTIIVKVLLDNSDTILGIAEMKGARGMIGIPKLTHWAWVFFFLLIVVIITRNLLHSSYGRAVVSVREDEIAAKAMGIDVAYYKTLSFVLGSLFAGLGGALYAHINGFLHPNTFNFIQSFNPMIIIVFGGLGSVTGTLAAAFTWALVLEGFLRLFLPDGFETWRFVVYPLLLLLLMLLRPKGLLGDFEVPFLRQTTPPLSPTAQARKEERLVTPVPLEEVPAGMKPGDNPAAQEAGK